MLASLLTSGLYWATTAGLALAVTGMVAHAIVGLLRRAPAAPAVVEPASAPQSPGLSARESRVLRELVHGARKGEIAAALDISERTVKSHLKSTYQKLGVESRGAAVAMAVQRRLV